VLQLHTSESYTLDISAKPPSAAITAKTIYGALRALETLSQLVTFNFDTRSYEIRGADWSIKDTPRFPHRGVMIDTSRHFETIRTIKRVVDSLAYSKLNVLHWHVSDSQSFPMEFKTRPKVRIT